MTDDDDEWADADIEGDCPDCGGSGEVYCSCAGYGCGRCDAGHRTCEACDGSGFRPVEPDGNGDI